MITLSKYLTTFCDEMIAECETIKEAYIAHNAPGAIELVQAKIYSFESVKRVIGAYELVESLTEFNNDEKL